MADQSVEGYDRDFTWEHMNDKQNRYSHVRIVEQSDARVVVHWRYALVNVLDQLWKPDDRTGNGAWIDEYYYIYPDARGIRKVTWAKGRLGTPIQFQESLPLAHAGQLQGEVIHPDYVTVGNLKGERRMFRYVENPTEETLEGLPQELTIQMHNLKSAQKPFIVFEPGSRMSYLRDLDIISLSRPPHHSHWPVAQIPSDGRSNQAPDGPGHLLGFPISRPPIHDAGDREWWNGLYGMTEEPFDALVSVARSWSHAAELRVSGTAFGARGFDRSERAYMLSRVGSEAAGALLRFELLASSESPVRNVALVIENWGDAGAKLSVDGKAVARGRLLPIRASPYAQRNGLARVDRTIERSSGPGRARAFAGGITDGASVRMGRMRQLPGTGVLLVLLSSASTQSAQEVKPVAKWSFEEIADGKVTDDVSGTRDAVEGYRSIVPGVSGRALKLDGYTTRIVRKREAAPAITGGLTVDGWVALAAYPWNAAPVVVHTDAHRAGYFFGIGARGGLVLRLLVDGRWRTAESPDYVVPLRRWMHVAATYDRSSGATLYVDGQSVGQLPIEGATHPGGRGLTGNVQSARNADLLIGMDEQPRQPIDWHRDIGTQPAWYSLDGLLDEVRIFNVPLTAADIARAASAHGRPAEPALAPRVMPAGPPGPGRFGAYYTRLDYYDTWESLWQVGPHPDILIRFDRSPARLVFWRGTQYGPAWVTENNLWMADQSVEGYDRDLTWEHMNDKQNRYSHVRIVEQSDARVVVHWRYAPVNVRNELWNIDEKTRNGTWIDE